MISKLATNLGFDQLLGPWYRGQGLALMFHRVLPVHQQSHWTSLRGLEIDESLFRDILDHFVRRKFKFLSAHKLAQHMNAGDLPKKFIVITFDDGYKDNGSTVQSEMSRRNLPWTLYVTTSFPDGTVRPWWYALGRIMDQAKELDLKSFGGTRVDLGVLSFQQRDRMFGTVRDQLHDAWNDKQGRDRVEQWCIAHGADLEHCASELAITWDTLKYLTESGCDIGAHTVNHINLKTASEKAANAEILESARVLRSKLNQPVTTFAYPFGDRASAGTREFSMAQAAGFDLAFTTRNGWIFPNHLQNVFCVPRINVSGSFRSFGDFRGRVNGMATLRESGLRRVITE